MLSENLTNNGLLAIVPGPGLLFGLMLVAAIVGGYAARFVHVPRVVGYLIAGIALRYVLLVSLDTGDSEAVARELAVSAKPLSAIKNLALGIILFTIGSVFERRQLNAAGKRVLQIGLMDATCVFVIVFIGCSIMTLLTQSGVGVSGNLALSLLLAAASIATAPAATLFVLQEYDAKGPITDTILGVTGVNNVICIVVFHVIFLTLAAFSVIDRPDAIGGGLWLSLGVTTLGSIVLGAIIGTIISVVHAKLPISETVLIFFALFIILGAGESWLLEHRGLSYNFLLTSLVIGAIFANVGIDSRKLEGLLRTVGTPIFVGFFVMAGFDLHINELTHLGWVGGVFVLARLAGKYLGGALGHRWARSPERVGDTLGTALLCQAAVVIGLASFIEQNWDSDLARQFSTVILGSVVLFEMAGPLLVKRCVVNGGEVKAITLLRRTGWSEEDTSIVRLMLRSVGKIIGIGKHPIDAPPAEATVSHIMRTNVQFIHASDTMDEVLHFIERSTDAHFPVIQDDGTLAGVIHFSDVRDVIYDPVLRDLVTALDLADQDTPPVPTDMLLPKLLSVFEKHNVSTLPVVQSEEERRIIGLVEQRDLLRVLHPGKNS